MIYQEYATNFVNIPNLHSRCIESMTRKATARVSVEQVRSVIRKNGRHVNFKPALEAPKYLRAKRSPDVVTLMEIKAEYRG
jgi:hypothetical protein